MYGIDKEKAVQTKENLRREGLIKRMNDIRKQIKNT